MKLSPLLAVALLLPAVLRAEDASVATDSGYYYEGAPYNFIASTPREGTFYYNDFDRYSLGYTNTSNAVVVTPYFGGTTGNNGWTGAAIIGSGRLTFSGNNTQSLNSSGTAHTGNSYDPGVSGISVSGDGLPAGSAHHLNVEPNALEFSASNNSQSRGITLAFSTVGYEAIALSFDLYIKSGSANYTVQASADGGTTWTTVAVYYGLTGGLWYSYQSETTGGPSFDLSSYSSDFNNNPSVVMQILTTTNQDGLWESTDGTTSTDSKATTTGSTQVSGFDLLIDRVDLSGTAIPEPAVCASALGLAAAALAWTRRRRR